MEGFPLMLTIFADVGNDAGWASLAIALALAVERIVKAFFDQRFNVKFLLMEAAQKRCEEDSIKKDERIGQLEKSITVIHERGNIAAMDRNVIRSELDTVKSTVQEQGSTIGAVIPVVEKLKDAKK